MIDKRPFLWLAVLCTVAVSALMPKPAVAAQMTLTWIDNSSDESGFNIERRIGTGGTYQQIASAGPNITSYTDVTLAAGTTYCYRVSAFNAAGISPYSPEACATTAASTTPLTLTVAKAGTGGGTITSSPAGINCGSTCATTLNSGTTVTLNATPASGSTFAGWSGTGCSSGSVTLNANTTCTATFNLQSFTLGVVKAGTGSGTVTSSPAGINCGSGCSTTLNSGTIVSLSATPASGSTFAGWSGNADCTDGTVTVNVNMSCTATFNTVSTYTLTTNVVNEVTSGGSASGRIVSNPLGIDCGSDCTESYSSGVSVTLTAIAAANSKFSGWTGDVDCSDGSVTMNASKTCTAKFSLNTATLTVAKAGSGTVTSTPAGIACGTVCSYSYSSGTTLSLQATPDTGFAFSGWSGACTGTGNCTVTLSSSTTVTANFYNNVTDKIGVYRPSTGEWFLDRNGNGRWDSCGVDVCAQPFAGSNGVPVVGDWNGSGTTQLGLFVPASSQWLLDANGNETWDGCAVDSCVNSFGQSTDLPVVGQWTTTARDWIGVFRPNESKWHLDVNHNGILNACRTDTCPYLSVYMTGDIPVAGDWRGGGTTLFGLFRPSTGEWFLDRNGSKSWNGCRKDNCMSFGSPGDLPVTGDWNGTGTSKIGVFRPKTGEWFLDLNGNGKWDGAGVDLYVPGYGQAGDVPVVGRW